MICKNCSGEYSETLLQCPYCGTENKEAAGRMKKEVLAHYEKEEQQIRKEAESFPEKAANKWSGHIVRGVVILLIACVIITILAVLIGKMAVNFSFAGEERHLAKLEKLYELEDYEGMRDYINKKELYENTYDKYTQTESVAYHNVRIEEHLASIQRNLDSDAMTWEEKVENSRYYMENILEESAELLQECRSFSEDMIFLENEDRLLEFYEACRAQLKAYGYSGEEITQLEKHGETDDYSEFLPVLEQYFFQMGE